MVSKDICVFLAEGFEEIEALTVVDLLRRVDIKIRMVSVTGKKNVVSSHGIEVIADCLLEEVDFEQTGMIVLPGGMPGTGNLEACQPLIEKIQDFDAQGKYISAICAAPSILGHMGLLEGRNACCFPKFEEHLTGAGVSRNPVEVSDHIITSRGMGTAIPFALAIVARIAGDSVAEKLAGDIVYK